MMRRRRVLSAVVLLISVIPVVLGGPLTPENFGVGAGSYQSWSFEVSRSARVFGQFRTQGGEINVLVIDEQDFEAFRNGKGGHSYYDSGRVGGGQVELRLRSGRYVVIFDNRFSPYSSKTISSNLQLAED